jgi:hypothetical protein
MVIRKVPDEIQARAARGRTARRGELDALAYDPIQTYGAEPYAAPASAAGG